MNFSNVLIFLVFILFFIGCKKDVSNNPSNTPQVDTTNTTTPDTTQNGGNDTTNTTPQSFSTIFSQNSQNSEIAQDPGFVYSWFILDSGRISSQPYVKIIGPQNQTSYLPMNRSVDGNKWQLQDDLSDAGHYEWRYVDNTYDPLTNWSSWIENTKMRIDPANTSGLLWPFKFINDYSSYGTRNGWYAANETNNCGGCGHYDPNETISPTCSTHQNNGCLYDDRFAMDWNRCAHPDPNDTSVIIPAGDLGASFTSPVDGEIYAFSDNGSSTANYGYGKYVDVKFQYGNDEYIFRTTHLSTIPPYILSGGVGTHIVAGLSQLGLIGNTGGAIGSHAHCVLYRVVTPCHNDINQPEGYVSIPFDFSN